MTGQDPSPQTTLLILLGASRWPYYPDLGGSRAFAHAISNLRAYFLSDPRGFHLPPSNLLDLFDSDATNTDILNRISDFLRDHITVKPITDVRDIFVYYIGHGGITKDRSTFYLAIHRTHKDFEKATSIAIDDLAERLKKGARFQRRILILDCCFAAQALRFLQGLAPTELVRERTEAAFKEIDQGVGIPTKGTSFLASSGKEVRSMILPDESSTMFTSALLAALHTGDPFQKRDRLTLHTVYRLTEDFMHRTHGDSYPRPELHSPDQSEGDIATTIALFPNPVVEEIQVHRAEEAEQTRRVKEEQKQIIKELRAHKSEEERLLQAEEEIHQAKRVRQEQEQADKPEEARVKELSLASKALRTPTSPAGSASNLPLSLSDKRTSKFWVTLLSLGSVVVLTVAIVVSIAHQTSISTFNANATATANGIITTAHANATATIQATIPGKTWQRQNSGTSQTLQDVAWSGSQFVAVGDAGIILTSPDGRTWTVQYQDSKQHLYGVVWSDSQFVAVGFMDVPGNADGIILTSPNGRTWTTQNQVPAHPLRRVAWLDSQFMAVGDAGIILTSPNGRTWTTQKPITTSSFYDVAWSGSRFVVVGIAAMLTSTDGSTWAIQDPGVQQELYGVVWSGSQFMAVGTAGTVLTSPDGRTWTARNSDTPHLQPDQHRVAWLDSQFVILANHGAISTSPDGRTWTVQHSGIDQGLYGVAWSDSRFVVVGNDGTILTSPP